jgi:hypothetical protein
MSKRRGHYKDVIREKVLSVRLMEEEFLRLRVHALRNKKSVSMMVRDRLAGLIVGVPSTAAAAAVAAPTGALTEDAGTAIPTQAAVAPAVESTPVATAVAPQSK